MNNRLRITATLHCDLLIIGSGGAGLRCAANVLDKRPETRVIALTKNAHPQKSHTSTAQGGLAAVDPGDPEDKTIYHMFDTWKGSDCTADQDVIKKICDSSWEQILWLENRGMHFSRNPKGKLSKRTFGGHTLNFGETSAYRAVFEADRTGKGMMDTCWGESLKRNISFLNQSIGTELLFKAGRCVGCLVFKLKEGEFIRIFSGATVLATGGSGQVFKITTNCRQNTGDGPAVALQAGLPMMDPEAIQFHPTGMIGPGILASETLRSVGGILRNKDMEPFMAHYAPRMKELAPRDLVARAIASEIRKKRGILSSDHKVEHVWIDLRHLPDAVHEQQIPEVSGFFKKFLNLDPKSELCPVHPSSHYQMGGISTNAFGEAQDHLQRRVPGLFAIGECAAASLHGFNRLGTNSLLELITMGKFVGNKVLAYLDHLSKEPTATVDFISFDRFSQYLEARGKNKIGQIRIDMQELMTENVGVFRTEEGLSKTIDALRELKDRADQTALGCKSLRMNQELLQRWELDNLLTVSMAISQAALNRRESRGAHFRDDFPERDDAFNHHTIVIMGSFNKVEIKKREIDMSIFKAKDQHFEKFDFIERAY
ncbi:MAG: FAD-binding protein [Desulfobacterales bacterium]|jgi:succinate dehydrogenase / fumarate reductase flavoprotein subunit|nr:fumarate reductase (quinol) flavoprotein subunit [Desulfobacter sp.]MDP6393893.1 FAD-binding protein [Desulfobacterales bacterium]MDP6683321.1 FAD-binding protein [Desulfobacterales bacterium]MDP6808559.1 FAD-binding protein [Desulfobacterales bacterium]|tara:strand:+ start:2655 stop:4451 length:1797 start_codon:yes stop_codon:yes gene_type:complete